jgi:hypothetical protein
MPRLRRSLAALPGSERLTARGEVNPHWRRSQRDRARAKAVSILQTGAAVRREIAAVFLHIKSGRNASCIVWAGLMQNRRSGPIAVANRVLRPRIIAAINALGLITGPEAAVAAYGWPNAVKRRRLVRAFEPTASQLSATRRALARLQAEHVIVDAGRRIQRRKVYQLRRDAELLSSLTLDQASL